MSDYALDESPSSAQHGNDATPHNISLDDQNAANNSIIGKVKSRVSSILPNSLSKWFSPSSKITGDAYNGGINTTTRVTRRRRRIEIEDEDDENYEDYETERGEYEENHNLVTKKEEEEENSEGEDDILVLEDDESQNSEQEYNATLAAQKVRPIYYGRQPPPKRARLNADIRDSPLLTSRQPLIASTPAVGSGSDSYIHSSMGPNSSHGYVKSFNVYGRRGKKKPAYNIGQQRDMETPKMNTDIIELITTNSNDTSEKLSTQSSIYTRGGMSSRRSLNIPPSSSPRIGTECVSVGAAIMPQLKRQPLSSSKTDLSSPATQTSYVPPRRTSTTIHEVRDSEEQSEQEDEYLNSRNVSKYNGQIMDNTSSNVYQKPGHVNGSGFNAPNNTETVDAIVEDTASESGESGSAAYLPKSTLQNQQRKSGLFNTNMSGSATTRNSSRTSSFGNGLNFYSHLEGRKSLFTGSNNGNSNQMNNSTLSLTSLNRRQFNASIYGSTSALSDSRLLNTFSPFYKGKTTYGGAAAYNKYSSGASDRAVRITPTLIRPTSSLSTLSSSSCFLANNNNNRHQQLGGDNSSISSTAKRILDLINDFATPLSDAKKMANNLKTMPAHSKGRLNENDLNTSRAIRLSQIKTPYARPSVILQPSGNANCGQLSGPLPPVKELQVPTMSQLLQMKKIQKTTEKVRNITRDNSQLAEYSLPVTDESNKKATATKPGLDVVDQQKPQQQKHINKIRSKVSNTSRVSAASMMLQDEAPPPSINLPTLAFPLMQSVPKFDIQFSPSAGATAAASTTISTPKVPTIKSAFNTKPISTSVVMTKNDDSKLNKPCAVGNVNFKFSEPLVAMEICTPTQDTVIPANVNNYKFSPPLIVSCFTTPIKSISSSTQQPPQLKTTGSCLDVFNKPLSLPSPLSRPAITTTAGFGDKFKKSESKWECETCMIRNENTATKCVACETPCKKPEGGERSTFGQQFKKSSTEWECTVCMIRNKEEAAKCVACENPRKVLTSTISTLNTFGDAFKSKPGSWVCPTCMIENKMENKKCAACETAMPGCPADSKAVESSTNVASNFKFGFSSPQLPNQKQIPADTGFQSIVAQQKASKWECDACMTRNDSERTKCACCEQPKPGSSNANENSSSSTFSFGATAAAKFSFGFGTASNAKKEEELRKENAMNATNTTNTNIGVSSASITNTLSPSTGFQFGIQKTSSNKETGQKTSQNSVASKPLTVGFKFEATNNNNKSTKVPEISSSANSVASSMMLAASTNAITTTTTTTTTTTPSTVNLGINAAIPTAEKQPVKASEATKLNFANTIGASSTTEGFSFGFNKKVPTTENVETKSTLEGFAFKTPAAVSSSTATSTPGFAFGTSATTATQIIPITTSAATTTSGVSAAAEKPMFTFGSSSSITQAPAATPKTGFGGFSFGSNNNNPSTTITTTTTATITPTPPTLEKTFGAVTSSTTSSATETTASTSSSSTPASTTNIFGLFGGKTTSSSLTFGSASANPATVSSSSNNNSSITSKPAFGSFGATNPGAATNVFDSFAGQNSSSQTQNKPLNSENSSNSFVFGTTNTAPTSTATTSGTNNTWPKNNFVFGSLLAAPAAPTTTATNQTINAPNKDVTKQTVFGNFESATSTTSNQQTSSSIFGNTGASTNALSTPAFGSAGSSTATNLFASANSTPVASNVFGANHSGNAATPAPAFGSSPFGGGGTASSTNAATPTFGTTAMTGGSATSFGSFGSANKTTNGPETKKPEPAFSFGSTAPTTQSTSGGFNFGSTSSKPAFNFGSTSTSQPAFNFTGSTESQNSAKPFQFGAIPSAPVFNFGGGASIEAAPSAPFQFNAGNAPVSSNIFAPAPTPGTQTAQQAKRKMRAPIRRVTQR